MDEAPCSDQIPERNREALQSKRHPYRDHQIVRLHRASAAGWPGGLHRGPGLNGQDLEGSQPGAAGSDRYLHRALNRQPGEPQDEVSTGERLDRGVTAGSSRRTVMKLIASTDRAFRAAVKKAVHRSAFHSDKI